MRDGYVARWRGVEYEASPDGTQVRLYASQPADGFEPVTADRYRRMVPLTEVDELWYARTVCTWQDEPFAVLAAQGDWLRVEYLGGQAPVAERLRLERFDFGVYQSWAPRDEIMDLREVRG